LRLRLAGECISAPGPATAFIGFNINKPPFNDRRVRQAFAHSVDRYTLANVILRGSAFPATGGFVPQGIPGHSPGIGLPYNPDLAKRLLADAGYPGGKDFPVIHSLASTGGGSSLTDYLTSAWQTTLGINIQSEEVAWVLFDKRRLEMEPHLYRVAWLADYPDPDSFLRVGVVNYYPQVWNEEYDRLVNNARQINDHERRPIAFWYKRQ
jgi:oligopeptide transport system substrate-binding protein